MNAKIGNGHIGGQYENTGFLTLGIGILFLFIVAPAWIVNKWSGGVWWESRRAWKRQTIFRALMPLCVLAAVASREVALTTPFPQLAIVGSAGCIAIALSVADWRNMKSDGVELPSCALFFMCSMNFEFPIVVAAAQSVLLETKESDTPSGVQSINQTPSDWVLAVSIYLGVFGIYAFWTRVALPSVKKDLSLEESEQK